MAKLILNNRDKVPPYHNRFLWYLFIVMYDITKLSFNNCRFGL
jgi:hypothetical protein